MLPSRLPNLLINGSSGIAVGIATKIPPHHMGEVVAGLKALIRNPNITVRQLMQYIPAPDFPTGEGRRAWGWRSLGCRRGKLDVRAGEA